MPKLKMTEEQKRENIMRQAIARGKASQGIEYDMQIAESLGISPCCYSSHQAKCFKRMHVDLFFRLLRRLKVTDRELCAMAGIPYRPNEL